MKRYGLILQIFSVLLATGPAHAEIVRYLEVAPGIHRGSKPETNDDFQFLKDHGIKTILSLQTLPWDVSSEREDAEKLGFVFKNVGIGGSMFPPSVDDVNAALETLTDPANQPIYVHCKLGRDRTSMIVGLYRIYYQGWTSEEAYREMEQFGFAPGALNQDFLLWGLVHYYQEHDDPEHRYTAKDDSQIE